MGIETIGDLLEHYPRDYKDRSRLTKIADLSETDENTFLARVKGEGQTGRRGRLTFTRLQVFDDTDEITLLWYNQPYMKTALKSGEVYLFTGRMQKKYNRREIVSPEYESIKDNFAGGRIVPVYPSVDGISQKMLRSYLEEALKQVSGTLTEELPLWIRKKYHLAEKNFAQTNIHFPRTEEAFYDARRRLVFEEFFLLQTALFSLREELLGRGSGIVMEHPEAMDEFQKSLPFSMTNAQKKVLSEIAADMTSGKIMSRLVQGDVGSGKTAVAMAAAYWAIQNGYQAVLMAPTEVLAEQHGKSFTELFAPLGIEVALLTGSMKAKEKREALAKIADGTAKMIVGTHAVIQKGVEYHKIGLVITDEQHRFGVRQRSMLAEKGENPHVLVMTATPIPRTLALILYGDLDISIIDELPPGRQQIDTIGVNTSYRQRIYAFLGKEAAAGRQAYVICPMIEENEKMEVENVLDYTNWKYEGVALAVSEEEGSDIERGCIMERPKVIYNGKTGKFVLWFHLELKGRGYGPARAAVAVSDRPEGPYRFVSSGRVCPGRWPINMTEEEQNATWEDEKYRKWWTPVWHEAIEKGMFVKRDRQGGQMSRDMTLFTDDDGKAYHIYSSEDNLTLQIAELTEDYLSHSGRYIRIFPAGHNEAPAIFIMIQIVSPMLLQRQSLFVYE